MERTKKASAMSKQLVSVFLLGALIACETKTPSGPGGVTPTTSTTTTVVTDDRSDHDDDDDSGNHQPGEELQGVSAAAAESAFRDDAVLQAHCGVARGGSDRRRGDRERERRTHYIVSGVYVMGNGTTGAVDGELKGVNPLENGGNVRRFHHRQDAERVPGRARLRGLARILRASRGPEADQARPPARRVHSAASTRFRCCCPIRARRCRRADHDHDDIDSTIGVDDDVDHDDDRRLHLFVYAAVSGSVSAPRPALKRWRSRRQPIVRGASSPLRLGSRQRDQPRARVR